MSRIALFGGSFNPVHTGHVSLAREVVRLGLADEVWLLVSPHNPLKAAAGLLSEQARLRLAQLAVAGEPGLRASDFEFHLPRPSYTWNTLCALRTAYPRHSFSLLIGADNWCLFHRWAHTADILRTVPIIVYPRPGSAVDAASLPPGVTLLSCPLFPYSSTDVRRALRAGHDCTGLIPPAAYAEIKRQGYYAAET